MLACTQEPTLAHPQPAPTGVLECVRRFEFADGRNLEEIIDRIPGVNESARQVTELYIERIIFISSYRGNRALFVAQDNDKLDSELSAIIASAKEEQAQVFSLADSPKLIELGFETKQDTEQKPLTIDIALSDKSQLPKALETIKLIQFTQLAGRELKVEKVYLIEDKANLDSAKTLLTEIIPTEEVLLLRKLVQAEDLEQVLPLARITLEAKSDAEQNKTSLPLEQASEILDHLKEKIEIGLESKIQELVLEAIQSKDFITVSTKALTAEPDAQEISLEQTETLLEPQTLQITELTSQTTHSYESQPLSNLSFSFNWNELISSEHSLNTVSIAVDNQKLSAPEYEIQATDWVPVKEVILIEHTDTVLQATKDADFINLELLNFSNFLNTTESFTVDPFTVDPFTVDPFTVDPFTMEYTEYADKLTLDTNNVRSLLLSEQTTASINA